jgi:hypothetical protein
VAPLSITGAKVAANTVTAGNLAAGAATGAALGADVVTTSTTLVGDVGGTSGATAIGALKVTTSMLAANAVTAGKLGAGAATGAALGADVELIARKNAASGYMGLTAAGKANLAQLQEILGIADLSDVSGTFPAGSRLARNATGFVASGLRFSATSYGVAGDNNNATAVANSTALDACIAAALAGGEGSTVELDWNGIAYLNGAHKLNSRVAYVGNGYNRSKLADSRPANTNVYESASFQTLTQTRQADYTVGEYETVFVNHIIDGNTANNASGGCGIAYVGYGHYFDQLLIENCTQAGWWNEWTLTTEPMNVGLGSKHQRGFVMGQIQVYNCRCVARPAANTRLAEARAAVQTGDVTIFGPGDSNIQSLSLQHSGTVEGTALMYGSMDFTAGTINMFDLTIDRLTISGNHNTGIICHGNNLYAKYLHLEGGYVNLLIETPCSGGPKLAGKLFNPRPTAFTRTGNITSANANILNFSSTTNVVVGMWITGAGIPAGTVITAISGTTVTISQNATATTVGVVLSPWPTEIVVIGSFGNYADLRIQALDNANPPAQYCRIANTSVNSLANSFINIDGQIGSNDTVYLAIGSMPTRCRDIDISYDDFSGGLAVITPGWMDGPFLSSPLGLSGATDAMYRLHYTSQPTTFTSATATAAAGAATLQAQVGTVTSEALTTAAAADYVLTLTDSFIKTTSHIFASVTNGTNTTEGLAVNRVTPAAGSAVIHIRNTHATVALNGTIKINFYVVN